MPLEWNRELRLQNELIDADHRQLLGLINQATGLLSSDEPVANLGAVLAQLAQATLEHFAAEERIMVDMSDPSYDLHKLAHDELIEQLRRCMRPFDTPPGEALPASIAELPQTYCDELADTLQNWLIEHIAKVDMLLKPLLGVYPKHYFSKNQENFNVHDRNTILMILRGLVRRATTLSAAFSGGADLLLTTALKIDPKEDAVYLDVSASEARNRKLLAARHVIFLAHLDGAIVQWVSTAVTLGEAEGHKAFAVKIPEQLKHVQRRSSYRVDTPVANPAVLRIPLEPGQEIALNLVDICVNGISVALPPGAEPALQRYAEFENCRIEHADLGVVTGTLVVKSVWEVALRNGTKSRRAGLEFVAFQANSQAAIQRFVHKLERRIIATTKDTLQSGWES